MRIVGDSKSLLLSINVLDHSPLSPDCSCTSLSVVLPLVKCSEKDTTQAMSLKELSTINGKR